MRISATPARVGAVAATGLAVVAGIAFTGLGSADAATGTTVIQDRLAPTSMTAGTAASASLSVHADRCVTARSVGVAVRDAAGNNLDFPGSSGRTRVCQHGYTLTTDSRTLPAGEFTVFGYWQDLSGGYHNLPAKRLTVNADAAQAPAPSQPSATATATPTPAATPSSAPTPTAAPTTPTASPTPTAAPTPTPTPSPSESPFATPKPTPTATSTPTATADPSASGTLTFSDDFTGSSVPLGSWTGCSSNGPIANSHCSGLPAAVDAKWWAYPSGWKDTSKNGTYNPAKALSIADGQLNIHLNRDSTGTWVAAPTPKLPANTTYGTYEVTWKASCAAGYKVAWLLWPDSDRWPGDGEIDFPEGDLCGNVSAFMHRQNGTSGGDQDAYSTGIKTAGNWHVSRIEWQPNDLKFYLDGKLIGHSTSRVPNTPMHWVLQSETALDGTVPAVGSSADIAVDSVRYWKAS
ncbi:glycoside hydrolase family 16 protein [Kitasatospora terrestris]|uniref:GH16 domain-containing protein n=1 Tax=Kitasatospora terrestris TaxID=258051 RepID=A0ABP9E9G5_9ACTN